MWPVAARPRQIGHPPAQLALGDSELPVAALTSDLGRMLETRTTPRQVTLHARRIGNGQLLGDEIQHRCRHVQRVGQERAQRADGHQLEPQQLGYEIGHP